MKRLLLSAAALCCIVSAHAQWTLSGTHIYNNNAGNVGIGTQNPEYKLDVVGRTRFQAGNGSAGFALNNNANTAIRSFYGMVDDNTVGIWGVSAQKWGLAMNVNNGYVGVGTTNPISPFHIAAPDEAVTSAISIRQSNDPTFGFDFSLDQTLNGNFYLDRVHSGNKFNVMTFDRDYGNVLIGKTSQVNKAYRLDVAGPVRANEIVVNTTGADFVFADEYRLRPLNEVEQFINTNNHLPEIPSAKEMQQNGVAVGELQTKLLQKVEELTLYVIEQNKQLQALKKENQELKSAVKKLNK